MTKPARALNLNRSKTLENALSGHACATMFSGISFPQVARSLPAHQKFQPTLQCSSHSVNLLPLGFLLSEVR